MTIFFNWYGQPDQPPVPSVIGVRGIGRRKVEITFDYPVIVREKTLLVSEPADRYTPVTWPGNVFDAANPDNYAITRLTSGSLVDPGEAVSLVVTHAEEAEEYWTEEEINGTDYIVSERVWVYTDYQQTARASYNVEVENVLVDPIGVPIGTTPESITNYDWTGFVVSQVPRNSLVLYETLPSVAKRLDREGTGDLQKFMTAIQEVFDRLTEDVDVFFYELCDIDRMRDEFLDALLYDLGNPFSGLFDLTVREKRKLASVLVQMYREKGTCEGIVNVVNFFLGVTLIGCTRSWEDSWRLDTGSYPSPIGDNDELGIDTYLAPGTAEEIRSFWLLHSTPGSLTADQVAKIDAIVEYMKPAGQHYLGIKAP